MAVSEWLTFFAILAGPVLAVFITRHLDNRRFKQERRYQLFKALMATRRTQLSTDHISALNMIEIEFNNKPSVVKAWKDYLQNLSSKPANEEQWKQISEERETTFTKLIFEMAKVLDVTGIDQIDIMKGGYSPNYWVDVENDQNFIRRSLVDILQGNKALPIFIENLFPETKEKKIFEEKFE